MLTIKKRATGKISRHPVFNHSQCHFLCLFPTELIIENILLQIHKKSSLSKICVMPNLLHKGWQVAVEGLGDDVVDER